MLLTPIAIIAGIVVGLVRGGQPKNLRQMGLLWVPLLVLGLIVQTVGDQIAGGGGANVLMLGSFILIIALGRNLHLKGMTIVSVGLLLNLTVLVFNGHVPTRFSALVKAGKVDAEVDPDAISRIGEAGLLETKDTTLAVLGDVIPIPLFNEVVSFGDLIMVSGLFVLFMNLLLLPRRVGVSIEEILDTAESAPLPTETGVDAAVAAQTTTELEEPAASAVLAQGQASSDPAESVDAWDPYDPYDPADPVEIGAESVIVLPKSPDIDLSDAPSPKTTAPNQALPARPSFEAALRISPAVAELDHSAAPGDES